ncbi:NADAR family protein [Hyphomicrobium sp. DMF-1]|uniref:NADAR family protein n=1 Tax=Hyphomicrobium sp. DMF-1 TaxID=3019544 RepID=UPI0022EBC48C|nr:NADAR family protein [Hyphomicrobium sp. DMF-1]WBT40130.1 NADAR family protein [Hyphomicrobium sp. DMF-1]
MTHKDGGQAIVAEHHKLDTDKQVFFYEQDFYVLSNFSAFNLFWQRRTFPTSEHAYHWEKFIPETRDENRVFVRDAIRNAPSAHAAFKLAEGWKSLRRPGWDSIKVDIMRDILRAKASQHEYVRRKLLATGDRELIEDSWRDDFWGWGPNRDGQNMLGKLWMEVRAELRARNDGGRDAG